MSARIALAIAATALVVLAALPSDAAPAKEPPSCAAISFRPVASGMTDGEQDAGLYKSRFGRLELKAIVKNGEGQDYFMMVNGKKPTPVATGIPKNAEECLKSKNVAVPAKSSGPTCIGSRFRVVIDSSTGEKNLMLFGLQGKEWRFCNAAKV
jgi:hypothetical protein